MSNRLFELFRQSSIPGFSHLFSAKSLIRKLLWAIVIFIFIYLTLHSLLEIISEYIQFPITVNVLVSESRVLKFPAVTVCNLNPVHKGRFCESKNISKPENIEKILCASLDSLMEVCNVYKLLEDLVIEGEKICKNNDNKRRKGVKPSFNRFNRTRPTKKKSNLTSSTIFQLDEEDAFLNKCADYISDLTSDKLDLNENNELNSNINRRRQKRQINLRSIFRVIRALSTGQFNSFSEIFQIFGISGESEVFFDNIIVQLAKLAKVNINTTQDLIPALFLKSFTDSTGCQIGVTSTGSVGPNKIHLALRNLTNAFTNPKCLLKLPKLFELFSKQSRDLMENISRCTSTWVLDLLREEYTADQNSNFDLNSMNLTSVKKTMENSWNVLLDILRLWLAELGKNNFEEAVKIGHRKTDLINSCHFAGKKCNIEKDFTSFFFAQYGNCYTYNLHLPQKENWEDTIEELAQNQNFHEDDEESLSGFTGPQFGLELVLNLETADYMPTTREIGAKVMVHDSGKRADPEEDSVQIQPGVVTYVGIQMINISRERAPYTDRCSDDWPSKEQFEWAKSLNHDGYTTQLCLKLCLQSHTIRNCGCWTLSAPWPQQDNLPICNIRKNSTITKCVTDVRKQYYSEKIICNCPPRCREEIYEKFVSTGKESRQCSALSANGEESSQDQAAQEDEAGNYAKLIIFYQSLTFNTIKQSPKYTAETLIGAVGGILGVYLGFSFLAIYEFLEVLFRGWVQACNSNSVEHIGNQKNQNEKDQSSNLENKPPEQIYHIVQTEPDQRTKNTNGNRSSSRKLEKSNSQNSDEFKLQINSFYDNLYKMKNDLKSSINQTKPKSRWIKIIKEREF